VACRGGGGGLARSGSEPGARRAGSGAVGLKGEEEGRDREKKKVKRKKRKGKGKIGKEKAKR
jgi:hypothetical protein